MPITTSIYVHFDCTDASGADVSFYLANAFFHSLTRPSLNLPKTLPAQYQVISCEMAPPKYPGSVNLVLASEDEINQGQLQEHLQACWGTPARKQNPHTGGWETCQQRTTIAVGIPKATAEEAAA